MTCQLARFSDRPCDGRLVRAHLIPKRMLPEAERWAHGSYVMACGGPTGIGGHHGEFDFGGVRRLHVPRSALPPATEALASRLSMTWFLDRTYGER